MLQIGRSNKSKGDADTVNVHRAADAWVHAPTNELFVADGYGNHRVIVFDADTGAFKRMWGAFGKRPGGQLCDRVGHADSMRDIEIRGSLGIRKVLWRAGMPGPRADSGRFYA